MWFLGGRNDSGEHAAYASQPVYELQQLTTAVGPQIPDFLRVEEGQVWIADAKWYRESHHELPGLGDVVKQMVYEMSVSDGYQVASNCFIVPHLGGEEVSKIGAVRMKTPGHVDERFPEVTVLSLDWRRVSDVYRFRRVQDRVAVLQT